MIVGERSAISEANDHVAAEAGDAALFHDVAGFPPNVAEAREAIVAYDRSVLTSDFHAVERTGEPSIDTNRKLDDLYDAVQKAEPAVGTSVLDPQAVSDLSDVTKARRNRNADAADTIPGPLFFLVVVISFAVLGVATLLNTRERGAHVTLLAVLAVVTALNLAHRRPRASVQRLDRGQRPTPACRRARANWTLTAPAEDDERGRDTDDHERPARRRPPRRDCGTTSESAWSIPGIAHEQVRRAATGRRRGRTSSHPRRRRPCR